MFFKKIPVAKKYKDKGGKSRFCVETFLPHSDEKCQRGTRQHFINFGYRKRLDGRVAGGWVSKFSVEAFFSHSAGNFRKAIF